MIRVMAAVLHNSSSLAPHGAAGRNPYRAGKPRRRRNLAAVALISGLHFVGLYAVVQIPEVRQSVVEAAPLFVEFMMAPAPKPEPPRPVEPLKPTVKPTPRPVEQPK